MDRVSTDVMMGELLQDSNESMIRLIPKQKLVITMTPQRSLAMRVLPVEMWARPWMVEDSRNSRTDPDNCILSNRLSLESSRLVASEKFFGDRI